MDSVASWLEGKDVLITGATGFMGKVLVEKLLRRSPGINRLFLVIRAKRNNDPASRLKAFEDELFGTLLQLYPNAFDKLVVIPGDLLEVECGISKEHQELLKENVSVVFHGAASVRFDDSVSYAIKLNARGTLELLKLAKGMKKLEVFEYVSTAYTNSHLTCTIEEKVYATHLYWQDLITLVDKEEDALNPLMNKLLGQQRNTYTLTKALAEEIILDAGKELPCIIVRPSVVMPTHNDPLPGWVDNINGIVSMMAGSGKGVLRVVLGKEDTVMDMVPVDVAINGMICAAWAKQFEDPRDVRVYNETYSDRHPVTSAQLINNCDDTNKIYPLENYIWYPFMIMTTNVYHFTLLHILLHMIPGFFLDLLLKFSGNKPIFYKLNIKMYNAMLALAQFGKQRYRFANQNYRHLYNMLCPEDREYYIMTEQQTDFDIDDFALKVQYGLRKYYFHEKDEDLPKNRRVHKRLYYIHMATKYGVLAFLVWKLSVLCASYLSDSLFASPSS